VSQRRGEAGRVQSSHLDDPQQPRGDGLQGGHVRATCHGKREVRPQGLCLDAAQDSRGVGLQLKIIIICHLDSAWWREELS